MPSAVHSLTTTIVFRLIIAVIVLLLQWLVYHQVRAWVRTYHARSPWILITATTLFLLFNGAFIVVLAIRPHALEYPEWFLLIGVYPFMIWFATTVFLGFFFLVAASIKLPFKVSFALARRVPSVRTWWERQRATRGFRTFDEGRRQFLRRGLEGTTAVMLGSSAYGVLIGRYGYEIDSREFVLHNLHPAFDGVTITLVSDIHSSVFMTRKEMDHYVRVINELRSDIIVVPGDFVNGLTDEVYPFAESFSNLKARMGVFGVTGNHDYYVSDSDRVIRQVEECGIKLLHDDKSLIRIGDAKLTIIGVDDVASSTRAFERIGKAINGKREGATILLCHRPYYLPQASEHGVDLMLSGHTHGGQIVLASFGNLAITPAALASPYVSGEYHHGKTILYVSRGIGTVGIPVRLNCPPEITRITLRCSHRQGS